MKKSMRLLAGILAVSMMVGTLPFSAFAEAAEQNAPDDTLQEVVLTDAENDGDTAPAEGAMDADNGEEGGEPEASPAATPAPADDGVGVPADGEDDTAVQTPQPDADTEPAATAEPGAEATAVPTEEPAEEEPAAEVSEGEESEPEEEALPDEEPAEDTDEVEANTVSLQQLVLTCTLPKVTLSDGTEEYILKYNASKGNYLKVSYIPADTTYRRLMCSTSDINIVSLGDSKGTSNDADKYNKAAVTVDDASNVILTPHDCGTAEITYTPYKYDSDSKTYVADAEKAASVKIVVVQPTALVRIRPEGESSALSKWVYKYRGNGTEECFSLNAEAYVNKKDTTPSSDCLNQYTWTITGGTAASGASIVDGGNSDTITVSVKKAGSLNIAAVAQDGTNVKGTISITIEQHVYAFEVSAPKSIGTTADGKWIAKPNTTITPVVEYNGNNKTYAPVSSAKKYTIKLADPTDEVAAAAITINKAATNFKINKNAIPEGEKYIDLQVVVSCPDMADNTTDVTVTIRVTNDAQEFVQNTLITYPNTVASVGEGEDHVIAVGSAVQLTGLINNNQKPSGYKVQWTVERVDVDGNAIAEDAASVSVNSSGKITFNKTKTDYIAQPGNRYKITLNICDSKAKDENKKPLVYGTVETTAVTYITVCARTDKNKLALNLANTTDDALEAYIGESITQHPVSMNTGEFKLTLVNNTEYSYDSYYVTNSNAKVLNWAQDNADNMLFTAKPKAKGTSNITVQVMDGSGVKQTFKITVGNVANAIKGISVPAGTSQTMYADGPIQLDYVLTPSDQTKYSSGTVVTMPQLDWSSSNTTLATAEDSKGSTNNGYVRIYPHGIAGTVKLTGTAQDGSGKKVVITVKIIQNTTSSRSPAVSISVIGEPSTKVLGDEKYVPCLSSGHTFSLTTTTSGTAIAANQLKVTVQSVDAAYDEDNNLLSQETPSGTFSGIGASITAVGASSSSKYTGYVRVHAEKTGYSVYDAASDTFMPIEADTYIYVISADKYSALYSEKNNGKKSTANTYKALFIGDSYLARHYTEYKNQDWGALLAGKLGYMEGEYGKVAYSGAGFVQNSAAEVGNLLQITEKYIAAFSPDASSQIERIVICAGVNDVQKTPTDVYNNASSLFKKLKDKFPNAKIYYFYSPDYYSPAARCDTTLRNSDVIGYDIDENSGNLVTPNANVNKNGTQVYCSIYKAAKESGVIFCGNSYSWRMLNAEYTSYKDSGYAIYIHPNTAGHDLIAAKMEEFINANK